VGTPVQLHSAYSIAGAGADAPRAAGGEAAAWCRACVAAAHEPAFTTYTPAFAGCIDYVLVGSAQRRQPRVLHVLSLPTVDEVTRDGAVAMPSVRHPSDHVLLAADVRF